MRNSRAVLCLSASILLTLASLGCGSGDFSPPVTAIAPTSHPLVAQYSIRDFHQGLTAWVEFGTDTRYGRQTSVMTSSSAPPGSWMLNILVAGMKPRTTYHMRAHIDWAGGSWVDDDQTFTTGALPSSQALPALSVVDPPVPGVAPAPGVELLSLVATSGAPNVLNAVVTDLQGNVIWYCPPVASRPNLCQTGTSYSTSPPI